MELESRVVMERTVVTPRLTLAGMADLSSQKLGANSIGNKRLLKNQLINHLKTT